MVDYRGLSKRLDLPAGWAAPAELAHGDIRAYALGREHLDDDVRGINASLELIRRTRGGSWPTGPVTAEYNYVDAVWHECEFRDGGSFTYAVYDDGGQYLGCCYLYPMGRRTRRRRELVGDARRLRTRPLHRCVHGTAALVGHRVPVLEAVLLQPGDTRRLSGDAPVSRACRRPPGPGRRR
jgi:hypothetical protein